VRLKLDENLDVRLAPLLAEAGHDVDTARNEGLSGRPDDAIYQACLRSARALITLDLDFSNPLRFPPGETEGIVVLRPGRPILPSLRAVLLSVLPELHAGALRGLLWIVEPGRIRVHHPRDKADVP
jgi:predicted nuclease of predicted toxin-antitoxin system